MNKRMDRTRLNIGAYILKPYARTEAHIRDVVDCGIDFITSMDYDLPALDLFHKHGLGAIVGGIVPGWWGGDGSRAGQLHSVNPPERYEAAARAFEDHPAIWGIDIGDEPSALDFPYYGEVFDYVNRAFPCQFPYLNLYPNYASVAKNNADETVNQLGTATYAEHIRRYCQCVPADYLCYDFYLYSCNVAQHYENLKIVADACRDTGRSMWIVLQVNSLDPNAWISENQLRFQAYTAMAFGAENIIWACYTAGWWHHQVLDDRGNKTRQYEKLKKINGEIRSLADTYMKYRRVATHFVGMKGHPDMQCVEQEAVDSLSTGIFMDLAADGGEALVIGEMSPRNHDGSVALMICAADDHHEVSPKSFRVTFRCEGRCVKALGSEGHVPVTALGKGVYSVSMSSNQGLLLTAR